MSPIASRIESWMSGQGPRRGRYMAPHGEQTCGALLPAVEDPSVDTPSGGVSFGHDALASRSCRTTCDSTRPTARSSPRSRGDARISNARLAERVGIAPSTCLVRVRALRERGVIQRLPRRDRPRRARAGRCRRWSRSASSVHDREQIVAFTDAVRGLPGVLSVFHMPGVNDYLVWVAARDTQDLREFVVDHLATHPAVAHAETSLIYEHRRGPGIWGAADPA